MADQPQFRLTHAQVERILAALPSIVISVDAGGVVTHWNAAAEAALGIPASATVNRPLAQCPIRWDSARLLQGIETLRRQAAPVRMDDVAFTAGDGRAGLLGITMIPVPGEPDAPRSFLVFGADITARKAAEAEQRRLQEELVQAQKMETIGRFAGGIAHDFQTVLQIILGFACLLRNRYRELPDLRNDVEEIVQAAEGAAGMIRQLLTFSRRQALKPTILEMSQMVRNAERLIQQVVGERIRVVFELDSDPLLIRLDPTAMEQILINLCSNAKDSMRQGGALTIRTACLRMETAMLAQHPSAKEGEYVRLSVQDTGTGMDPNVAANIFEPFFTTKSQGKGTGLGLAVVYGLVRQHDAFIEVETAVGRGTTFHLYFPRQHSLRSAEGAASEAPAASPAAEPGAARAEDQRPRILVVDDETAIRNLCVRALQERYAATAAPSGPLALEALSRSRYDLLLTDLRMPEVDGFSLIEEAAKLCPGLKVLVMSAFLTSEAEDRLRVSPLPCRVIRKPFTPTGLQEAVRRSLSEQGG